LNAFVAEALAEKIGRSLWWFCH